MLSLQTCCVAGSLHFVVAASETSMDHIDQETSKRGRRQLGACSDPGVCHTRQINQWENLPAHSFT